MRCVAERGALSRYTAHVGVQLGAVAVPLARDDDAPGERQVRGEAESIGEHGEVELLKAMRRVRIHSVMAYDGLRFGFFCIAGTLWHIGRFLALLHCD